MTLTFGTSGLARAAHLRADPPAATRVLALWRGNVPVQGSRLVWLPPQSPVFAHAGPALFLGYDAEGPLHARDISDWSPEAGTAGLEAPFAAGLQPHPELPADAGFTALRDVMAQLTVPEAEAAATAKALVHWNRSHRFCASCGHPSDMVQAGWQRNCPACATQHFPRTDPVVIMLVLDGDRLLLGRSPGWRSGLYSCLAGFVEPGETVEAAVRREVMEETGVGVGHVRYLCSQPWPYPASLMLGCVGQATSTDITIDPAEIEAARWADKAEVMEAMIGRHPDVSLPPEGTIAHHVITRWLADDLD
ncbi:NAD(+) diphosphatase [Falsirhodobacter deserti]|uniref:NAD(+) diphosphatase n=1 Tax=Falsirhodobacter deserti TaxID=1365611 RepID=UPI000FE3FDDF|nr:NAD(+) diphosphatase [Falsirhodobacter deserti]